MKKLNNKGFSLVELIIVIAIMAILVGVMAPSLMKYIEKSRLSSDIQMLDNAYSAMKYAMADEAAYSVAIKDTGLSGAAGKKLTDILSGTDAFCTEVKSIFGSAPFTFKSKAFTGKEANVIVKMNATTGEFSIEATANSGYDNVTIPATGAASGASGT